MFVLEVKLLFYGLILNILHFPLYSSNGQIEDATVLTFPKLHSYKERMFLTRTVLNKIILNSTQHHSLM